MATTFTLRQYEVTQPLEGAEKTAFSFVKKEDRFNAKTERKQDLISKVGGLSTFWIIMSFIGIPLAIVFAIYESNMAQQAIVSLLDPLGLGTVNSKMIAMIGAGLAVFAMFMGHIFAEGFQSETNEITGRSSRNMGVPFYFSIAGLIGYIGFQYYLVQAAGDGGAEFNSFAMIAIGVAILEILVGVLILGKSLTYILMFFITIQLWFLMRGMAKTSRSTNDTYRDYRAMRNTWNVENPTLLMELEGNDNIRRAIAYYGGIKIDDDGGNPPPPPPPTNNTNEETPPADNPDTDNSSTQTNEPTTEEEVEDFINNDEDNITL